MSNNLKPLPLQNFQSPFAQWDLTTIQSRIGININKFVDINMSYFNGDHWQKGDGWIGPRPSPKETNCAEVMWQIERVFCSSNTIQEVVNRHADSVLSRVWASWYLKADDRIIPSDYEPEQPGDEPGTADRGPEKLDDPITPDQQKAYDLMPLIREWWGRRNVDNVLRTAVVNLLCGGRSGLRFYIPQGRLQNGQVPTGGEVWQYLDMIFVEAPPTNTAMTIVDPMTMTDAYMSYYSQYDITDQVTYRFGEISYVDSSTGLTVITLYSTNPKISPNPIAIDLNGFNIFYQMERSPLVSEQVRQNQKSLNMARTMMNRNTIQGGFLERVILSAQLPGKWVTDATDPSGKRFIPDTLQIGAGRTTTLMPIVVEDDEGKRTVTNPDVRYRDPVAPDTFIKTILEARSAILHEVEQIHMEFAGSATATGDGRVQAKANYATSLMFTKKQVDGAVEWMINVLIAMVSNFTKQDYTTIRSVCDARIDVGPLTAQEKTVLIDAYKAGLVSRETTMSLLGSDNIAEEINRIDNQKRVTTPLELAAILTALSKTGWQFSFEQMPVVDTDILGMIARNVGDYKAQLEWLAKLQAPAGGNTGELGGSPAGSTNKPGSQSPGPGSGSGPGE